MAVPAAVRLAPARRVAARASAIARAPLYAWAPPVPPFGKSLLAPGPLVHAVLAVPFPPLSGRIGRCDAARRPPTRPATGRSNIPPGRGRDSASRCQCFGYAYQRSPTRKHANHHTPGN
jgi:hypothetical protein